MTCPAGQVKKMFSVPGPTIEDLVKENRDMPGNLDDPNQIWSSVGAANFPNAWRGRPVQTF